MRILMLAPFGIRPKGTLSARMLPLARALAHADHQVAIVAPPIQNRADAGQRQVIERVILEHLPLPPRGHPAAFAWSLMMAQRALAAKPDLVHLFKPKGFGGLAALLLAALRPRLPLVVDCDDREGRGGWNDLLPYPAPAKALFAWQERDLPRRAAAVTVASQTLGTLAMAEGVASERIFYLPNGSGALPPPPPRGAAAAETILLYTRFWELDLEQLLATWALVAARAPQARLLVIGAGERGEEQILAQRARACGLAERLDVRGWVEPSALPACFAEAQIALAPIQDTLINRARGMAKLVELMGAGFAIVACDVGIARDYLGGGAAGRLVAANDPAALAEATIALLNDRAEQRRLGAAATARAAVFRWERLAPIAEAAYHFALARR